LDRGKEGDLGNELRIIAFVSSGGSDSSFPNDVAMISSKRESNVIVLPNAMIVVLVITAPM
jgi:hypothetical protein